MFTATFAVGAALGSPRVAPRRSQPQGSGVAMRAIALALLARAHRRFYSLVERRARLERELGAAR